MMGQQDRPAARVRESGISAGFPRLARPELVRAHGGFSSVDHYNIAGEAGAVVGAVASADASSGRWASTRRRGARFGRRGAGRQTRVVLSDGLWRRRFGGDHRDLGQTLSLNGDPTRGRRRAARVSRPPAGMRAPVESGAAGITRRRTGRRGDFRWRRGARLKPDGATAEAQSDMAACSCDGSKTYPDKGLRLGREPGAAT